MYIYLYTMCVQSPPLYCCRHVISASSALTRGTDNNRPNARHCIGNGLTIYICTRFVYIMETRTAAVCIFYIPLYIWYDTHFNGSSPILIYGTFVGAMITNLFLYIFFCTCSLHIYNIHVRMYVYLYTIRLSIFVCVLLFTFQCSGASFHHRRAHHQKKTLNCSGSREH